MRRAPSARNERFMNYQRIACLSTEAVETLYLLGAEERIVLQWARDDATRT